MIIKSLELKTKSGRFRMLAFIFISLDGLANFSMGLLNMLFSVPEDYDNEYIYFILEIGIQVSYIIRISI